MKKNAGFGVVAIVIVIAVVVIVGVVTWRVYDAYKQQPTQNQQSSTPHTSTSPSAPTTPSAVYLQIKELGVKIQLDDKTRGESYRYNPPTYGNSDSAFIFDSNMLALDNANKYCKGANAGLIGLLLRSTDPYAFSTGGTRAITVDNITSFKIGAYYYQFQPPQHECSEQTDMSQKRTQYGQNFISVLKTIQSN